MIGFFTVPEGERVAIWDRAGRHEIVSGPRRVFLFLKRVEPLKRVVAGPTQYLIIRFRDGGVFHQRGPAEIWVDPVEHAEVVVSDAISLDAHQALVVYRQEPAEISRRVARGPAVFVPDACEWIHQFSWHGSTLADARHKAPKALNFTKLRVIPDQLYYDVDDVRTSDDALLIVRLMVFFELADINTMLDATHDPIADFINAATADVIDFAATLTFEEFKEQTDRLSDITTYAQLSQRAARIGYLITKVVYRGYAASPKLQAMHDNAIETRTRLRLETETEQQVQALADLKLTRRQARSRQKQEMEQAEADHQITLKRAVHDEDMRELATRQDVELSGRRASNAIDLQRETEHCAAQAQFFEALRLMQVDLTRYLVAQYQNPDRVIRLEGEAAGRLHLHE